jgi:hypothetical protein
LGIFLSLTRTLTRAATKIKTVDSFRARLRLRDFIQLASYSHPDTAKILVGYRPPFSVSAFTVAKSSRVIRAKNLFKNSKSLGDLCAKSERQRDSLGHIV